MRMLVTTIVILSAVILLSLPHTEFVQSLVAQQQQPPRPSAKPTPKPTPEEVGEGDVVRVDTDIVTLTATVTDSRGRYVANLKQNDFTVYEDGVKQQLSYYSTGDRVPISLGIIFDTSGSMGDKIDGVEDAVKHFVKTIAKGDEIFVVRFSDDAELVQDFTDDRSRILQTIERLNPQGSTALYDAVLLGLQHVADGKHRKRALLLLTDGNDTASSVKYDTVLSLAKRAEIIIYGLGIGHGESGSIDHGNFGSQVKDEVDMKVLNALADATGGRAFYLEKPHAGGRDLVDEAAEEVAAELKQQYTLGYRPSNMRKDGQFRQIKVELADKSLRVRTKRGYYAQGGTGTSLRKLPSGMTRG